MTQGQDALYSDMYISGGSAVLGNVYNHHITYQTHPAGSAKRSLLEDLYFDTMNSRRAAIYSAEARTCDWIWNTNFASWVGATNSESNVFWICGKPGSGKSTLMKYLSTARKLRQELPSVDWVIVNFFFDFRQKDRLGNTMEGLLRSLLIQIIEQMADSLPALVKKTVKSSCLELGALKELFDLVFHNYGLHLCIIIDGLDEYTGNMRLLMDFLVSHSHRANVKMCLASRPNPIIGAMAGPSRIHMSEYNLDGIRTYIDLATRRFIESHNENEWCKVCSQIEQRAEGVFLWVHLVTEEILHAFTVGETFEEIMRRLDDIPDTLDLLYQRILDAIPKNKEIEVATIYELIDKAEIPLNLGQLHGMILFLNEQYVLGSQSGQLTSQESFLRRVQSTGGELLHFRLQEPLEDPGHSIAEEIRIGLVEYGASITHVSIMHKTVSSFLARSQWAERRVPRCLSEVLSSHPCKRIAAQAVVLADAKIRDHIEEILLKIDGKFCSLICFKEIIKEFFQDDYYLLELAPLLHFGILQVIPYSFPVIRDEKDMEVVALFRALLQSRLAILHFALSWSHYRFGDTPSARYLDPDVGDLMMAAEHGLNTYLEDHSERFKTLQDYQRNSIIVQLLSAADIFRCGCLEFFDDFPRDSSTYGPIRSLIKRLLSLQQVATGFHAAVHLFIQDFGDLSLTSNFETLVGTCPSLRIEIPSWNSSLRSALVGGNPLFIWACGYTPYMDYNGHMAAKKQLRSLLSLGISIDYQNEDGEDVCTYLISTHLFCHIFSSDRSLWDTHICFGQGGLNKMEDFGLTLDVLERLYLREEYGIGIAVSNHSRKLLQAFCRGRAHLLKGLQKKIRRLAGHDSYQRLLEMIMVTLDEIQFVLHHKAAQGHLPQPMVHEQDLSHYYCRSRKSCLICEYGFDYYSSGLELAEASIAEKCESEEGSDEAAMEAD